MTSAMRVHSKPEIRTPKLETRNPKPVVFADCLLSMRDCFVSTRNCLEREPLNPKPNPGVSPLVAALYLNSTMPSRLACQHRRLSYQHVRLSCHKKKVLIPQPKTGVSSLVAALYLNSTLQSLVLTDNHLTADAFKTIGKVRPVLCLAFKIVAYVCKAVACGFKPVT